jgi:SOS response regulatory protein OraA/RecX
MIESMDVSSRVTVFIEPALKKWVAYSQDQCILTLGFSAARPIKTELKSCLTLAELKKLIEKAAIVSAVELLSKRDYLKEELRKKLTAKGIWNLEALAALNRLENEGILDDRRYVRSYIASKALRYGAKMLRVKLFAKGAEKAIVDELLFEAGADGEELLIRKAYAEALRRKEDLGDFKIRQRWIQRLLRRGCSFERVRSFLDGIQSSYSD